MPETNFQDQLTTLRAEAKQIRRRKGHVPADLTRQIAKLDRIVAQTPAVPSIGEPAPLAPLPIETGDVAPKKSLWKKKTEPDVQDSIEGV